MIDIQGVEKAVRSLVLHERENRVYATGYEIDQLDFLPSISIPGQGKIDIPISSKDLNRLKKFAAEISYPRSREPTENSKIPKSWQIYARNILSQDDVENSINKMLPVLLKQSVAHLKFGELDASSVDIVPQRLTIYENGSHYEKLQDEDVQPDSFATLYLQIPSKTGYTGGNLEVFHGDQSQIFDFSTNSKQFFYVTFFYSECYHRMFQVTKGAKVFLACSLVWKHHRPMFTPIAPKSYENSIRQSLENALGNWRIPGDHVPRMIAIPLEHMYSMTGLSFNYLKGSDRLIASLLQSLDFIDLHLVIGDVLENSTLRNSELISGTKTKSLKRRRESPKKRYSSESENSLVFFGNKETITEYWVSAKTCTSFPFKNLKIDGVIDTALINTKSTTKIDTQTARNKHDPLFQHLYYNAMLVLWPSPRTIDYACRYGFVGSLDILELLTKEISKEQLLFVLGRVVAFCCSDPRYVWCDSQIRDGEVAYRLLQLCLNLKVLDQGLIILSLLAEEFPVDSSKSDEKMTIEKKFEGIQTKEVASIVAQFIRCAGWDQCVEFIYRMTTNDRLVFQTETIANLVTSLLDCGLTVAAKEVANRVCSFVFKEFDVKTQLDSKTNKALGEMIFRLEEYDESRNSKQTVAYINWLEKVETRFLCESVIYFKKSFAPLIKRIASVKSLYIDICWVLVRRQCDYSNMKPITTEPLVVSVLQNLFWLRDAELVRTFIHKVTRPTVGNNRALEDVATSLTLWETFLSSFNGKLVLTALVECRLLELSMLKKPSFSWEMPEAVIPDEPELESFLRSSQHTLAFSRKFETIYDAQLWAMKIFGFAFEALQSPDSNFFRIHRYSATVHIRKVGGGAMCNITKNRRLFEYNLRQYKLKCNQKERLIQLYRKELIDVKDRVLCDFDSSEVVKCKSVKFDLAI